MEDESTRRCKVGIVLPAYAGMYGDRTARWSDIHSMAQRAESLGFDSVWMFDHFLVPVDDWGFAPEPLGSWEGWSMLAAVAATTSHIELGTLVACTNFRSPGMTAKMADAVDEISDGRLILGLGAGSMDAEFSRFGLPLGHRASRFEEAVQIIRSLLRGENLTFEGRFHTIANGVLIPRGPRADGPPVLIGARQPRMYRIAARHADLFNIPWTNRAHRLKPLIDEFDAACREVGRDPATVGRTAGVMVDVENAGPNREWVLTQRIRKPLDPIGGSVEEIAEELSAYARLGVEHLQVWLNPSTVRGLEAFAPVLEVLDKQETVRL